SSLPATQRKQPKSSTRPPPRPPPPSSAKKPKSKPPPPEKAPKSNVAGVGAGFGLAATAPRRRGFGVTDFRRGAELSRASWRRGGKKNHATPRRGGGGGWKGQRRMWSRMRSSSSSEP